MLAKISNLSIVKQISRLKESEWQWLLTLAAALIAWRVIYIQHGWINDDSVLYFEVARLFSIGQWKEGVALYNWPMYPALITLSDKISDIGFQRSAQILNVVFFAVTTFSFISLIRLLGGSKTTILYGTGLLFSSPYIVGDILPMLLRDQGFWACFLTSIAYFIKFYRDGKSGDVLLWQVFAILAVLFRIEAAIFLACLPFVLLVEPKVKLALRVQHFFKANLLPIALGILGMVVAILHPSIHLSDFGRLEEIFNLFDHTSLKISQDLTIKSQVVGKQILGDFLDEYGLFGLILTLLGIVLVKSMSTVGWLSTILLVLTRKTAFSAVNSDSFRIVLWVSILALINAYVIILSTFILSGRYLIALAFMLLILAAFSMESLVKRLKSASGYLRILLVLIIVTVMSMGVLSNLASKKHGYNYEQNAVSYVKQLQPAPNNVFYVSPRARYYAGAQYAGRGYNYWEFIQHAIADGTIQQYDYLVLNMNCGHPEREKILLDALPSHRLIKEFMGFKGKKKIMIFSRTQKTPG